MALHIQKVTSASKTPEPPNSLDKLSETAKTISAASRKLTDAVDQLNASLKKLNLGVTVWVETFTGPNMPGEVEETEFVGYARVKGKWGVCLSRRIENLGPEVEVTEWHFAEAPRDMRLRAAAFLSRIVPALQEEADGTAVELEKRAGEAEKLAEAILSAATKSKAPVSLNPATFQQEVAE